MSILMGMYIWAIFTPPKFTNVDPYKMVPYYMYISVQEGRELLPTTISS